MKRCEKQYYSPEYPFTQDSNHTAFLNCLIRLPYVLRKVYYISGGEDGIIDVGSAAYVWLM